jgi:hypothetical protein
LEATELRLRSSARPLYFIYCLEKILHGAIEIREIKPHWRSEERGVDEEFKQSAPKRIAPHRVEHSVVLLSEAIRLLQHPLIGFHIDIYFTITRMVEYMHPLVAQWIEQSRPKGEMWVRFLPRGLYREQFFQFLFVKSNDEILPYRDDGDAHLSAFLNHFFALLKIARDVVIGKRDVIGSKKILRRMAEVTGRCRVNGYRGFCRHNDVLYLVKDAQYTILQLSTTPHHRNMTRNMKKLSKAMIAVAAICEKSGQTCPYATRKYTIPTLNMRFTNAAVK